MVKFNRLYFNLLSLVISLMLVLRQQEGHSAGKKIPIHLRNPKMFLFVSHFGLIWRNYVKGANETNRK